MADPWTERLSEYLDGELAPEEREALATHLDSCAVCATTLEELREVVSRARGLADQPPAQDLWPGIAQEIAAAKTIRLAPPILVSLPALAAAAIALVLIGGSLVWLLRGPRPGTSRVPVAVTAAPAVSALPAGTAQGSARYDAAVTELRQVLAQGRERLDPATVRVLEQNLAVIDRAIAEAEAALARDPASGYLNRHLAETRLHKLELLRNAALLARAAS